MMVSFRTHHGALFIRICYVLFYLPTTYLLRIILFTIGYAHLYLLCIVLFVFVRYLLHVILFTIGIITEEPIDHTHWILLSISLTHLGYYLIDVMSNLYYLIEKRFNYFHFFYCISSTSHSITSTTSHDSILFCMPITIINTV